MASKTVTISIDDKTDVILGKIKSLRINRSGLICDLLASFEDNDYRIPVTGATKVSAFKPEAIDEEELAEIRRDQGLDDE